MGQKRVFGHISCPLARFSKISSTSRCGIPMYIFVSLCKNCERNFFRSKIHFCIFRLCVKGFFPLGFSFSSSVGTFQREREFFFSSKNYFFIPGKLQFRTVQLKKQSLIISSWTTCQKFRKIGSLGDSYGIFLLGT